MASTAGTGSVSGAEAAGQAGHPAARGELTARRRALQAPKHSSGKAADPTEHLTLSTSLWLSSKSKGHSSLLDTALTWQVVQSPSALKGLQSIGKMAKWLCKATWAEAKKTPKP